MTSQKRELSELKKFIEIDFEAAAEELENVCQYGSILNMLAGKNNVARNDNARDEFQQAAATRRTMEYDGDIYEVMEPDNNIFYDLGNKALYFDQNIKDISGKFIGCVVKIDGIKCTIDNVRFVSSSIKGSNFENSIFRNVTFDGGKMVSCNINDVLFSECVITDVVFKNMTFDNVMFNNCIIKNCQFENCVANNSYIKSIHSIFTKNIEYYVFDNGRELFIKPPYSKEFSKRNIYDHDKPLAYVLSDIETTRED